MPVRLYDSAAKAEEKAREGSTSMVTGTVVNNCDLINQGRVSQLNQGSHASHSRNLS